MTEQNGDHRFAFFRRGVDQTLANAGPRRLSAIHTLEAAVAKEKQRLIAERPKVFLAMPAYSTTGTHDSAMARFMVDPTDRENLEVMQAKFSNSLLGRSFNHLWAQALVQRNRNGITHFAMIHTDVAPEQFWLDKLWEEMLRVKADLLACVIPIKSLLGLSSVAVDNPDDVWQPRRLAMTEVVEQLPETFGNDDVIEAGLNSKGGMLLHNTGCFICDLRRPWVDAVDGNGCLKCFFTIHDCIKPPADPRAEYFVGVQSEDWNFSRQIQTVDPQARLFSTRKIKVDHMGETGYPNWRAWGQWKTDQDSNWTPEATERTNQDEFIPTAEVVEKPELIPA